MASTFTNLLYHIVFSTKNRQRLITSVLENELHRYMGGVIRGIGGTCIHINGTTDHVHILAVVPPKIAISDALRDIKANSSKWANESGKIRSRFGWQDGYAAFTVSRSQVDTVQRYIRNQKNHHREADFKSELQTLLDKHGVEYDERYIWG